MNTDFETQFQQLAQDAKQEKAARQAISPDTDHSQPYVDCRVKQAEEMRIVRVAGRSLLRVCRTNHIRPNVPIYDVQESRLVVGHGWDCTYYEPLYVYTSKLSAIVLGRCLVLDNQGRLYLHTTGSYDIPKPPKTHHQGLIYGMTRGIIRSDLTPLQKLPEDFEESAKSLFQREI